LFARQPREGWTTWGNEINAASDDDCEPEEPKTLTVPVTIMSEEPKTLTVPVTVVSSPSKQVNASPCSLSGRPVLLTTRDRSPAAPVRQHEENQMNRPEEPEIIAAMQRALGNYFRLHPEITSIKVRCYGKNESLLHDLFFSPSPEHEETK
jgi:hypothetical protein